MNLINYLQFLEPMQEQVSRVYSTVSGILAVILIVWAINFIAGLIQKTYGLGVLIGKFYRNYLHKYIRSIVLNILSLFNFNSTKISA